MKIRLYPSIKKKPKEAAVEIQVMLEKVQLEKHGTVIFRVSTLKISDFCKSFKTSYRLWICITTCSFCSINEFMIVYINKDNFERLTKGKILIPQDFAEVMKNSSTNTTIKDIWAQTASRRMNLYAQREELKTCY